MITTETMFHTISNIGTELPKPQCLYRQSYILLVAVEEKKKKIIIGRKETIQLLYHQMIKIIWQIISEPLE